MFKAITRLLIFWLPLAFLDGFNSILFDNLEITSIDLNYRKRKKKKAKKEIEQDILLNYLKKCHSKNGDYKVNDGEKKTD